MIFDIVKKTIDEWDPYSLLDGHAPQDEFDIESQMIADRINANSSLEEINIAISEVFTNMFEKENFIPEKCLQPAQKLKNQLNKYKNIKIVSQIGNIILWVLLVPSVLLAFFVGWGHEALGVGYSKFKESIIIILMILCIISPITILITATRSLVLILKDRCVQSMLIQLIPLVLILVIIILFTFIRYI